MKLPSLRLNPTQATLLISGALTAGAFGLVLRGCGPVVSTHLPVLLLLVLLTGFFVAAEQTTMRVEFYRQAHSFTIAGVPLAFGILVAPPEVVVAARVIGALIGLLIEKMRWQKAVYNTAAYAFEAALDALCLGAVVGNGRKLDLPTVIIFIAVIAVVDQLMSMLVLGIIRLHGGTLSREDVLGVLLPALGLSFVSSGLAAAIALLFDAGSAGPLLVIIIAVMASLAYRGYAATRQRHQALALVHEFVADGVGAESVAAVSAQLLARTRRLLRAASAELMLIESVGDDWASPAQISEAALVLSIGEAEELVRSRREVDPSDWVTVRVLSQDEPILATGATKDRGLRRWLDDRGMHEAIVVPLPASSNVVGTLMVRDRMGDNLTFNADDVALLQTLTGHLAVAVRNARLVEKLGYDATHDALTGLVNRVYLTEQIHQVLSIPNQQCAVLLLDLDRFKEVNDVLGHAVGDRLLTEIAGRLLACAPPDATVARLGGDEFAVLLPSLANGSDTAMEIAEQVAAKLSEPLQLTEARLTPEASVGVAVSFADGSDADLMRQADTAMYAAKGNPDVAVALYTAELDRGRVERLALTADLRLALESHPEQLVLHYQPKIDLQTGVVTSVEALVRWNHPTMGVLGPDRFIPLAESTGLIERLSPHVLDMALAECRLWSDDGHAVTVAVNLSARNVGDPSLPARVASSMKRAGVKASQLILEITESSVMGDAAVAVPILHELADLGVCLSLDDFGTGYSSLSYLQKLPVAEVKVDRSFVSGLVGDDAVNSRAVIRTIAGLGASLGLRVVAEGVEDEPALEELRELGCHVAQGYFISRPLSAVALHAWLAARAGQAQLDAGGSRLRLLSRGA